MEIKIAIDKLQTARSSLRMSARAAVCVLSLVVTAIGCAWVGTYHSVRFNDFQSEREMGRLPPLPTMANGMNDLRLYWAQESGDDYTYEDVEKGETDIKDLWQRAGSAESNGDWSLERELLGDYLKHTAISREPGFCQPCRNSAIDRLDALSAITHGSSQANVQAYLKARHAFDSDKTDPEEIERTLEPIKSEFNLKDNVAYLRAAETYRANEFEEAAKAFAKLAASYSHSEKREAALFMAAVATMKSSNTYVEASGNSDYTDDGSTIEIDEAWHEAFSAFQRLMHDYPHGRYFNDARGWLAYLLLRKHDRAGAMIEYYRLLASDDENARIQGAFSLTFVRSCATENEMSQVEKTLESEPRVALAYAYHNIYNYAIDPGSDYPDYHELDRDESGPTDYESRERRREEIDEEWQQHRDLVGRTERSRVLNFAKRLLSHYPSLQVGGAFALRAAQASVELDDNQNAVTFVERALRSGLHGDQRAQALWTLGIAEHRLRQFDKARKAFETLLKEFPVSSLTEGTRRSLAMIAEDSGDIDTALEQYIALDYNIDVAYFVDTLMTTEQLTGFLERHPDSPKANEFTYALAIRYLRADRWQDARQTLARVRTASTPNYSAYSYFGDCDGTETVDCWDPKDPETDSDGNLIITPALVMRDVQTANDLEALELKVNEAVGDEAKAEALYQVASYQYQARSLLFYNPLASPGYWNLGLLSGKGKYRAPNESQILWNATQERERLARALNVYLEVVDRFPQTRAARDALYTAAVCHERLSNYNPYWRGIYQAGLHAGKRMVTYEDVKTAYPNYQLPRGTYGWQPASRNVNGGPGFQPPPKPPVRPTKTARVKSIARWLKNSFEEFWVQKGERWLTEAIILGLILFVGRVAARSRRRLRARIARQRLAQAKEVVVYPWLELFWIDHVEPSRREQFKKFLGEKRQEFVDLARDGRSRPVLVKNIVSHAALAGLLISLLWTVGSA
jgi:outer membrane protein assembly factor BamD (BamD/ComL family)